MADLPSNRRLSTEAAQRGGFLPLGGTTPPASWANKNAVYTPGPVAEFLVGWLEQLGALTDVERALEPSVGGAAWVGPLLDRGIEVVGADVDPHCPASHHPFIFY